MFQGTWKVSTKRCDQLHIFFAVQTILSFGWDLEKFRQKCVPSYTFFFSLWRLTWVFDGTWKNFHKKLCPVTRFFAVETILSFWWDLESFGKKIWPVTHFFRSADFLKLLKGLGNIFTKSVPSLRFLRCGDYLKFLMGLRKTSTKICAQLHVFSLWRLTWVFDGPWKNFHKKVYPVTQFFAVPTILNFWWDLKSFDKKVWPVTRFFAVETLLSVSGDLESFDKKMWPVTHFFRSADYLKFWMGLRKVSTKMCAQLHVFFRCGD